MNQNNYNRIQDFLDLIKQYVIYNKNFEFDDSLVYSLLIRYNLTSNVDSENVEELFPLFKQRYFDDDRINLFEIENKNFLWFEHGKMRGNEVKLYIPIDREHLQNGANMLFDFIASTGIEHQSKIATIIRNDNVVVRVNSIEDANKIISFVNENQYIKEGLNNVNPFLPNCGGVGLAMDNNYSFNSTVADVIADFISILKQNNRLDLFTVDALNSYITECIDEIDDLDLKDIYILLSKTTTKDFELQDFADFAYNKKIDDYDSKRRRITDPKHYLEKAILVNEQKYHGSSKNAILEYLNGDSSRFTRDQNVRDGLMKYVSLNDLEILMTLELRNDDNSLFYPNKEAMVEDYVNSVLLKHNDYGYIFGLIEIAYKNTMVVHGKTQADFAFKKLYSEGFVNGFTNKYGDRQNIIDNVLNKNIDIKKVILNNIDYESIDINNSNDILQSFLNTVGSVDLNNTLAM